MTDTASRYSSKWEAIRLIILEVLVLVSALVVAHHQLRVRDVLAWGALNVHFGLLILLFIFAAMLVPRRVALAISGFVVFYVGVAVCDKAYRGNVHPVIMIPFAACFLIYALASKQLRPGWRVFLGIISLLIVTRGAIRFGEVMEFLGITTNHTRFVRYTFTRLRQIPPSDVPSTLDKLSQDFYFPMNFDEEDPSSTNVQKALEVFGLDDHLTNGVAVQTNANPSILLNLSYTNASK